ncbi:MAG: AAA family ATPase [Bacteroidales bacterium]|nr:AAA family ATPase [Bacteroidales bacterium]
MDEINGMKIQKINIKDFRCFGEFSLNLKPGINLLVGDNASGKTSLLKACKYAISCFFSGFSDDNTAWVYPLTNDFRQSEVGGVLLQERPIEIEFSLLGLGLPDSPQSLVMKSVKNCRPLLTPLKDLKLNATKLKEAYTNGNGQTEPLPLIECFTTEDIHVRRSISQSKFKETRQKPSFGYYECLEGNGFLPYWEKRLLVLKEEDPGNQELAIVTAAIAKALGPAGCGIIDGIVVRPNAGKVCYRFTDGRIVDSDKLSDGYRRLVNLVTNLAFRCAILNRGIYGLEACRNTQGVAIIDEVDLHLHPSLQARVLPSLTLAFPNLQIIASSHSPMVMSGVETTERDQVLKLDYVPPAYSAQPIRTYGMDLSSISSLWLGVAPREQSTQHRLDRLYSLLDQERYDELAIELERAKREYGDTLPELDRLQTELDFERGLER